MKQQQTSQLKEQSQLNDKQFQQIKCEQPQVQFKFSNNAECVPELNQTQLYSFKLQEIQNNVNIQIFGPRPPTDPYQNMSGAPIIFFKEKMQEIKQYDESHIKILQQRIFDGELKIESKIRDIRFIENLNVQKLELFSCYNVNPVFTSKTVKELIIYNLKLENFKNIHLENLEVLKLKQCDNIKECSYFGQVRKLELVQIKNVEQLFSQQICNNIKELFIVDCQIQSLQLLQSENVEVLHLLQNGYVFKNRLNQLRMQNFTQYKHLKELHIKQYDEIDTTPLNVLNNLQEVNFEDCNSIIINFNSKSIHSVSFNKCIFQSIDCFQLPNLYKLSVMYQRSVSLIFSSMNQDQSQITAINQISTSQDIMKINILDAQKNIHTIKFNIQLEKLNINNCRLKQIDMMSFLVNLKELDLANNCFNDLTPLQNLVKLTKLNLSSCEITNIEPLQSIINLEDLDLSQNSNLTNLIPLQKLMKLAILNLKYCQKLKQFDPLRSLIDLKQLILDFNDLKDISFIKYLTNLQILNLYQCNLSNIDVLTTLVNLKELDLYGNTNINITPLQYLTELTKLILDECYILSVEALMPLQKLKELHLYNNSIVYVKPLLQLKKLNILQIQFNKIIDFPLEFSKFLDFDEFKNCNKQPTVELIQKANILRDINFPVYLLRNINTKNQKLQNDIRIRKSTVNQLQQEQIQIFAVLTGKLLQSFELLNSFEDCQ
ncbi:Conserved_hypothetical protein [Hexamita inflata]|uniref:Uncharacterized protein n=1 Tax=Hexamita inflata TaxID=28002 RepID=A0AA86UFT6_9EUKA|nr:Conserved hypothetical protein [Hexamita inflata]